MLHVISVVSNPCNYESRYRLYRDFARRMKNTPGIVFYTVELVYPDQDFKVTSPNNPCHLQLRSDQSPLWSKENMVNLAVKNLLPPDWQAMAWIDADVAFMSKSWVDDALFALQHPLSVIQLFDIAIDLGDNGWPISTASAVCSINPHELDNSYCRSRQYGKFYHNSWHPGYAWAINRSGWNLIGGLMDFCILGSADHYMALSLLGRHDIISASDEDALPGYHAKIMEWAEIAYGLDYGVIKGGLCHYYHGKKAKRYYNVRKQILNRHQFDPATDLTYDHQGLLQFAGNKPVMEQEVHDYFYARDEDN